jgi:hypothetical protein
LAWPSLSDYSEALQNPRYAFSDLELQNGTVIVNKLGQPRPVSGNFATVFQVQSGNRTWAVRCFSREITDQKDRYDAISQHLKQYKLPFMVGFQYLTQGIRAAGRWYPIVKMEWMKGLNLDSYIEQNLNQPNRIQPLVNRWVDVCRSLREASIAHGDLQHGNIVVMDNGDIKLIDYDGIYIQSLIGKKGYELGHRHYQHPTRKSDAGINATSFLNIDNFSTWVIRASLQIVAHDPALWRQTGAGEDSLIFRDSDYNAPNNSKTFATLRNHRNLQIRELAEQIVRILSVPSYLDVLPLDEIRPKRWSFASWMPERLPDAPTPPTITIPKPASWIADYQDARFSDAFVAQERKTFEAEYNAMNVVKRFSRLVFSFQDYVTKRVDERFPTYPEAIERKKFETVYYRLVEQKANAEANLELAVNYLRDTKAKLEAELQGIEIEIAWMWQQFDETPLHEQQEIAQFVENDRYQTIINQLSEIPISVRELKIDGIVGFGKKRIECLHDFGIRTAADLHPGNEILATQALSFKNASPEKVLEDWQRLLDWRNMLEQMVEYTPPDSDSPEIQAIRDKYADYSRELTSRTLEQKTLETKQRETNEIQISEIQAEIEKRRKTLAKVTSQFNQASEHFKRYSQITPADLIDRILKS